jgi:AbrB family looped-hinge helix DNA binding protein
METVKVSSKGQIVIPKSMRDTHQIRTGTRFIVTSVGDELRLNPIAAGKPVRLDAVAGMLRHVPARKLTDQQVKQQVLAKLRDDDQLTKSR